MSGVTAPSGWTPEVRLGRELIGILVFVDDVMSVGGAEDIKKAIRNCRTMESLKKKPEYHFLEIFFHI